MNTATRYSRERPSVYVSTRSSRPDCSSQAHQPPKTTVAGSFPSHFAYPSHGLQRCRSEILLTAPPSCNDARDLYRSENLQRTTMYAGTGEQNIACQCTASSCKMECMCGAARLLGAQFVFSRTNCASAAHTQLLSVWKENSSYVGHTARPRQCILRFPRHSHYRRTSLRTHLRNENISYAKRRPRPLFGRVKDFLLVAHRQLSFSITINKYAVGVAHNVEGNHHTPGAYHTPPTRSATAPH